MNAKANSNAPEKYQNTQNRIMIRDILNSGYYFSIKPKIYLRKTQYICYVIVTYLVKDNEEIFKFPMDISYNGETFRAQRVTVVDVVEVLQV